MNIHLTRKLCAKCPCMTCYKSWLFLYFTHTEELYLDDIEVTTP